MDRSSRKMLDESQTSQVDPVGLNESSNDLNDSTTGLESSRKLNRSISPIGQHDQSFETSEIIKPMILVDVDNKGMMKINKKAIEYLQSIKKNIAVLAVIGPYRTGKSFLMNRFAGYQKGFELGGSTNPCTQGIWMWGKPMRLNDNTSLLLLDSEGLGSYTRDENIDAKLFLLTCLLSSCLVYNVMNTIDERAIGSLSFIANLSVHLNAKNNSDKSSGQDISKYFPALYWVVRDFSLDLGGKDKATMTPKDYLENALAAVQGDTEETIEKNKIRRAILDYFKDRDCFTLIRPVNDENALRNIDKVPYEKLRPGFREQLESMIDRVFASMRPKVINDAPINGKIYTDLLITFVDSLNNSAMPSIASTWERIVDKEVQKALSSAIDHYIRFIKAETEGKFPMNEDVLNKKIEDIKKKGEAILSESNIISETKLFEAKEKYEKKLKEINDLLIQENIKKSKEFCNNFVQKIIEKMEGDLKSEKYRSFAQLVKEFYYYKKTYLEEGRGPSKMEVFSNFFVDNLLRILENYHTDMLSKKNDERMDVEKQMADLAGKNEALSELLKKEKELTEHHLNELKQRFQEKKLEIERRFTDEQDHWESKLEEAERWRKRLEEQNEELRSIINLLKTQGTAGGKKSEQITQEISRGLSKLDSSVAKDVAFISETLKSAVSEIKDMHQEKFDLRLKYEMEKEMAEMEKFHAQQLNDAKTLSSSVMDKLRESYEEEIRDLREHIKTLEKAKELHLVKLVEKEGFIRVLQEKVLSYERENKKQLEYAEMLCKISDQLVRVGKKIELS